MRTPTLPAAATPPALPGRFATALALCATPLAALDLRVSAVEPAPNDNAAPTASPITIEFDADVDLSTVASNTRIFGRWSGACAGQFTAAGHRVHFVPDRPFFPGELVTVRLAKDLAATGGETLAGGYTWSFFTGARPGSGEFRLAGVLDVRYEGEGLIQSYGAYAGDLDRDGAPDMSIPNEVASDVRVLLNDGCGTYAGPISYALPPDSVPSSNEAADFDGDGFTDLAVANIVGDTVSVLLGDGGGGYAPITSYLSGNQPRGVAILDADADGDDDIAIASRTSSDVRLHRNAGDGTFTPPTAFDGGGSGETAIGAADADGDGRSDLFVGHIHSQDVGCLLGDGDGGFSAAGATTGIGGSPWMIALGDVDGDGVVDVASCNFDTDTAGVLRGDGGGGFQPLATYAAGDFPLACDLGDLDADGDLDLVISNYAGGTWTVFENDGAGLFAAVDTLAATSAGSCATLVDYDRDGDVDIVGIDEVSDEVFLYPQAHTAPAGVQPSQCSAALRIDNLAGSAGFAGDPHPVPIGGHFYVGVSAPAGAPYAVLYGDPLAPALPLDFGLLSLFPPFVLPGGIADSFGEAVQRVIVPAGLPAGARTVVQAFVLAPSFPSGAQLTNPEQLEFAP